MFSPDTPLTFSSRAVGASGPTSLDDRDVSAEAPHSLSELEPDISPAENDENVGNASVSAQVQKKTLRRQTPRLPGLGFTSSMLGLVTRPSPRISSAPLSSCLAKWRLTEPRPFCAFGRERLPC
jgi:hypothetical protein